MLSAARSTFYLSRMRNKYQVVILEEHTRFGTCQHVDLRGGVNACKTCALCVPAWQHSDESAWQT